MKTRCIFFFLIGWIVFCLWFIPFAGAYSVATSGAVIISYDPTDKASSDSAKELFKIERFLSRSLRFSLDGRGQRMVINIDKKQSEPIRYKINDDGIELSLHRDYRIWMHDGFAFNLVVSSLVLRQVDLARNSYFERFPLWISNAVMHRLYMQNVIRPIAIVPYYPALRAILGSGGEIDLIAQIKRNEDYYGNWSSTNELYCEMSALLFDFAVRNSSAAKNCLLDYVIAAAQSDSVTEFDRGIVRRINMNLMPEPEAEKVDLNSPVAVAEITKFNQVFNDFVRYELFSPYHPYPPEEVVQLLLKWRKFSYQVSPEDNSPWITADITQLPEIVAQYPHCSSLVEAKSKQLYEIFNICGTKSREQIDSLGKTLLRLSDRTPEENRNLLISQLTAVILSLEKEQQLNLYLDEMEDEYLKIAEQFQYELAYPLPDESEILPAKMKKYFLDVEAKYLNQK